MFYNLHVLCVILASKQDFSSQWWSAHIYLSLLTQLAAYNFHLGPCGGTFHQPREDLMLFAETSTQTLPVPDYITALNVPYLLNTIVHFYFPF